MSNNNQNTVVFCYGEGGHCAQANRLARLLIPLLPENRVVTISDVTSKPDWSHEHYEINELRSKHSHLDTITSNSFIKIIKVISKVAKKENIKTVISTGPGMCLIAGTYFKLRGAKVIHIETWSRISTASLTGRFMYRIADKFYVQHESLQKVYPNAIYAGIL